MTIRVDSSSTSHLAHCTLCPSFRALRSTSAAAWSAGVSHEQACHPGKTQAANAAWAHRKRSA